MLKLLARADKPRSTFYVAAQMGLLAGETLPEREAGLRRTAGRLRNLERRGLVERTRVVMRFVDYGHYAVWSLTPAGREAVRG